MQSVCVCVLLSRLMGWCLCESLTWGMQPKRVVVPSSLSLEVWYQEIASCFFCFNSFPQILIPRDLTRQILTANLFSRDQDQTRKRHWESQGASGVTPGNTKDSQTVDESAAEKCLPGNFVETPLILLTCFFWPGPFGSNQINQMNAWLFVWGLQSTLAPREMIEILVLLTKVFVTIPSA